MLATPALGYDINQQLTIGGLLASALQCQSVSDAAGISDTCAAAVPFQPTVRFRPGNPDEVFVKFGFAAGNGLNDETPFVNAPWAADLEDSVKDINGRNRDYLLTAWYKHTFNFGHDHSVRTSLGIIDATDYLDENAYANDEYTQFMNATLTNGPNVFLPSYDIGAALEWRKKSWSFSGVLMDIGENDDGNNYLFYGLQASYRVHNRLGAGQYRVVITGSSEDFLNPAGTQLEQRASNLYSFDQAFGSAIGGWVRFGWQSQEAAINYHGIFSGGIDIKGSLWGRQRDNIGIGYAYLSGGNLAIDRTNVAEAYYRWQLDKTFGLTADIQYQSDDYKLQASPRGWIASLRAVAGF
ncbi:MAG: porin [Gammaproteobacteria bacterium]|nr:porin [Gammaproteobacteria bacterium]